MKIRAITRRLVAALCLAAAAALPSQAQEAVPPAPLSVELNAAETTEGGCRLSFLIANGLTAPITSLVLETVLFDSGGQVARLTLFDFGELPAGRPRVRQFVVPEMSCEAISAVLINGVESCDTDPVTDCAAALGLRSRVAIGLIG